MLFAPLAGLASGLLAYAAFPPLDLGPVAFFALVPLALLFRRARPLQFAVGSLIFSLTFFGLLLSWISAPSLAGYFAAVVAISLLMSVVMQIAHQSKSHFPAWSSWLIFPIAFFSAEYIKAKYPLGGFPWGGLGYSQHENPMMLRLAPYTGIWGISLIVLLVNSLTAEGIHLLSGRKFNWAVGRYGVAVVPLILFPALLPLPPSPDGRLATLAMVQGNVPEGTYDPHSDDEVVLQNHIKLSRRVASKPPALVIWAEGALDRDPFFHPPLEDALLASIQEVGAPFVVGGWVRHPEGGVRNASLFFDKDATLQGIYVKRKLVPFGERVPFRRQLAPFVRSIRRVPVDVTAGADATVFSLPEGKFGSIICYESTFEDLSRSLVLNGARLLVVSTNNSSFNRTSASEQHLIFSQLRAAEHRMWVSHTGISGISAVIDPDGRILEKSNLFEQKVMTPTIRFATQTTPYARWGDWVAVAVFSSFALLILLSLLKPDNPDDIPDDIEGKLPQTTESRAPSPAENLTGHS